jgi:hypothetical protein
MPRPDLRIPSRGTTPRSPPLGAACSDCRGEAEYLTAFRARDAGEPTMPLCGRCAHARVISGEILHSFDLFETPQELLNRVANRVRMAVREAVVRGERAEDVVGIVSTRHGSGGHYARPTVAHGPRSAMFHDLKARSVAPARSDPPVSTRRARRSIARRRSRIVMKTLGGGRLARPAPAGSVFVVVTTTEDAAVLLFPLDPGASQAGPAHECQRHGAAWSQHATRR